jgi:putative phosphoribosyl transferase
MFEDRRDAGQKLAEALSAHVGEQPLVLAIPRGGVAVGYQVAKHLKSDFSIVVVRKLPLPDNPEAGFGALAEDGSAYFVDRALQALPSDATSQIVEEQELEITRRVDVLRQGRPLPTIKDRTVILVDDGIAMGSTMRAAILLCRNRQAKEIVVASAVAGASVAADLEESADHVIILETPVLFRAVAQVYASWHDVSDEEVLEIMETWAQQLSANQNTAKQ